MKRLLALLLALVLVLSLAACVGGNEDTPSAGENKKPDTSQQEQNNLNSDTAEENSESSEGEMQFSEDGGSESSETPESIPEKDNTFSGELEPAPPQNTEGPSSTVWNTPEDLWAHLGGCWVDESGDRFVYFSYTDDGPAFWSGNWENPIPLRREAAAVTGLTAFEGGIYTLSITYPPIDEDAADEQDLRPLLYTISLDISDLDKRVIRAEAPEDQWREYAWGGVSYDDAYDASNSSTPYATFAEMQALWTELSGYWTNDEGMFIFFDQKDTDTLLFGNGIRDAGWGQGLGTFEKAMTPIGEIPLEFFVYYAPIENELDGVLPARHQRVYLDIMDLYTKNTIYARLGENGEWISYIYVDDTLDG